MARRLALPPPPVHAAAWLAGGLVVAVHLLTTDTLTFGGTAPWGVAVLLVLSIASTFGSIQPVAEVRGRRVETRVSLEEASVVLTLVVLPPATAWVVLVVGYVIGTTTRQPSLLKRAFNTGLWATTVGLAATTVDRLVPTAGGPGVASAGSSHAIVVVTAAVTVHAAINFVAVAAVVAAATGTPVRRRLDGASDVVLISTLCNLLLGIVAATSWVYAPWTVLAPIGLTLLLRHAYTSVAAASEVFDEARLERDRLDVVLDATTTGIVHLDHGGLVTLWNDAIARTTGIPLGDARGHRLDELLDDAALAPRDRAALTRLAATTPDDTTALPADITVLDADGHPRAIEVQRFSQVDRIGATAGAVLQFRDLSADRELSRLKDDFVARVTHELRTPLTAIIGMGATLHRHADELDPTLRDTLAARIVAAGQTLERLADDLLLVSADRASSGRTSDSLCEQPLAPHVERAVAAECAGHPGRTVHVDHDAPVRAVVDADWFVAIVRHLVSNALSYSQPGTPVTVTLTSDGPHVRIRVTDRGRGIPAERVRELFDRFTRVEDPLQMETRGAGLGLFVVERLVTRMGGEVEVSSTLGEGSTFEVRLPRPVAECDPAPTPRAPDGAIAGD